MKKSKIRRKENIQGWLSVLPVLLIILTIRGVPIVTAAVKSFTNWDGLYKSDFIGLRNYINILTKKEFWNLLQNNLILMIFIPIQVLTGSVVAVLLYEEVRGWKVFRTLYYLPQIISSVIVGFLFTMLFGYYGPINTLLRSIGLDSLAVEWLGNRGSGLFVIILCLVWINIGWQGMLVLGGLSSIDPEIYESAKLDGAGYWTRLFKITMPLIRRTIEYSVMTSVIWSFTGLFPLIFSLTKGGPGTQTMTIDYMIYQKSFVSGSQLGYSCALSIILLIIIMILTAVQMIVSGKRDRLEAEGR